MLAQNLIILKLENWPHLKELMKAIDQKKYSQFIDKAMHIVKG